MRKGLIFFFSSIVSLCALYAMYVAIVFFFFKENEGCYRESVATYPSPGGTTFAETVISYCVGANHYTEAAVWLSHDQDFSLSVSAFKSSRIYIINREEIPKNWNSSQFKVIWIGDEDMKVVYPDNMGIALSGKAVEGVNVHYARNGSD